jgi:hypothetical protein
MSLLFNWVSEKSNVFFEIGALDGPAPSAHSNTSSKRKLLELEDETDDLRIGGAEAIPGDGCDAPGLRFRVTIVNDGAGFSGFWFKPREDTRLMLDGSKGVRISMASGAVQAVYLGIVEPGTTSSQKRSRMCLYLEEKRWKTLMMAVRLEILVPMNDSQPKRRRESFDEELARKRFFTCPV